MRIGDLDIENNVILAPMAGVTDLPFRTICKKMGASLVYTEFVSSDGIIRENLKTLKMLEFNEFERPIGVQIFGNEPDIVADSAKYVYDNFKPDLIDINFGCPVPKVTKKGAGSAALKNLDIMKDMVQKVVSKVPGIPITVKMRAGWDNNSIVVTEAGKILENAGIQAITLHARTSKQLYKGSADWSLIEKLKNTVKIPVIGNGDVVSISDYKKIIRKTGCDGVMIGRGALGNPWIFRDIILDKSNKIIPKVTVCNIVDLCIEHIELLESNKSSQAAVNLSKKHINFYMKGFENSSKYRIDLMRKDTIEEIKRTLLEIKN
jgi:tRNA-dihydrouridine synthase B